MEQEIKAQTGVSLPFYEMDPSAMKESNSLNGLVLQNRPIVTESTFKGELQGLVLDKNQSRGTQKPERRSFSAQTDTALKISVAQSTTSGTKPAKPTTTSFKNSYSRETSEDLKDRFIALDLKLDGEQGEDYKIYLECEQFDPSDVKVRLEGDFIVVRAKHQSTFDDHGMVKREFTRRWRIPEDVKRDKFSCLVSRNNMLIIKAPRKPASIVIPVEIEKTHG